MIKPCILCQETPEIEERQAARGGLWAQGAVTVYHLGCSCGRGSSGVCKSEVVSMWNDQADDLELAHESREALKGGAA